MNYSTLEATATTTGKRVKVHAAAAGGYRPDIDGLRAVAVLSVLVFHAFPALLPGGFVGVDVFFAISGFLITGILLEQERVSILAFYARRVRRIFPALALTMLVTLALGALLLLPAELAALGKHTLAGSLSIANLTLLRESGYFAAASRNQPLLHLWSLGVEEQFYLAWPWLVGWLRGKVWFVRWLAAGALLSLIASVIWTRFDAAAAFYLPFTRLWELALGGLVAYWDRSPQLRRPSPRNASLMAGLGVLLLAAGFAFTRENASFPGAWPLLPVLGALLLMAAGPHTLPGRLLSTRPFVAIGLVSYPLYLWHWPLLALGSTVLGDLSAPVRVAALLASGALATATYLLLETPVRRSPAGVGRPALWLGVLAAVGGMGAATYASGGWPGRMHEPPVAPTFAPPSTVSCPGVMQGGGLAALNYCRVSYAGADTPEVALLGDSHAERLFDALAADGRRWILLGNSSCPPLQGVQTQTEQPGCHEKFQRILGYLASPAGARIHTVYVTHYGAYTADTDFSANHLANHYGPSTIALDGQRARAAKEPLFERGLEAYVTALEQLHKRVVLIEDVPEFPFFPQECAQRTAAGNWLRQQLGSRQCTVDRASVEQRQAAYLQGNQRLAAKHPSLRLVHMLDLVCSRLACGVRDPAGDLLYEDSHHLSVIGARKVVTAIRAQLSDSN